MSVSAATSDPRYHERVCRTGHHVFRIGYFWPDGETRCIYCHAIKGLRGKRVRT